jgi:adenosylcobinamide kinase/adenosylcobinamide-phosphate guanylyltransferase
VIPLGEISRLFVDHAGWMNQAIAKIADKVTFVAAGLPMTLKETDDFE